MKGLVLAIGISVLGCATSAARTDVHPLAMTVFRHEVEPDWHLRSISVRTAGEAERGLCTRAREIPRRIDLVYARADGSQATPVASTQCAYEDSFMSLAVHQTADQGFVVGKYLPKRATLPPPAQVSKVGDTELIPARALVHPPAEIPPSLQVSERGHKYHVAVCTDVEGKVIGLRLIAHHHPEIDARILDALMKWKYEPARLNGRPVPSCPWAVVIL
jgi:hypothetical protein